MGTIKKWPKGCSTHLNRRTPERLKDKVLSALDYLYNTPEESIIVISDLTLPKLNGLNLQKKVQTDAELNLRSIPLYSF